MKKVIKKQTDNTNVLNKKTIFRERLVIVILGSLLVCQIIIEGVIENTFSHNKKSETTKNIIAFYIQNEEGEYEVSSLNKFPTDGYVLNMEKSACTNGGTISQNTETKAISMSTSPATKCNLYFEIEKKVNESANMLIAKANESSVTDYNSGNKGEMFTFSHPATTQTEALTDYRYIGNTPNNYIDFNNETWRIIGVFTVETESGSKEQLIKIIRDESIGDLAWDSNSVNKWSTASLKNLLNGDYYNQTGSYTSTSTIKGLSAMSRSQVVNVKWYLGGSSTASGLGGPNYYAFERGTTVYSGRTTNIMQKVGLMYPSDYAYTYANGVDNKCYTDGYNCNNGTPANGWLYKSGTHQWTMSPDAGRATNAFYMNSNGFVGGRNNVSSTIAVRPTVFLAYNVTIVGGDGTSGSHYRLAD